MERTKLNQPISYELNEEPIILSKYLLDLLLKQENPGDLIALYTFYYYVAKWQKTNQPKATTSYTASGLSWSEKRVIKNKNELIQLGLIKDIISRNRKSNQILGHYIRVMFIWSQGHPGGLPPPGSSHPLANSSVNSLSDINRNALSTDKEMPLRAVAEENEEHITPRRFESFWKLYPNKGHKGAAFTKWNKMCKAKPKDRPTWKEIKLGILGQIKSEQWSEKEFIPLPTTWLNQSRWLDDPTKMKLWKRKGESEQYDESVESDSTMDVIKNKQTYKKPEHD